MNHRSLRPQTEYLECQTIRRSARILIQGRRSAGDRDRLSRVGGECSGLRDYITVSSGFARDTSRRILICDDISTSEERRPAGPASYQLRNDAGPLGSRRIRAGALSLLVPLAASASFYKPTKAKIKPPVKRFKRFISERSLRCRNVPRIRVFAQIDQNQSRDLGYTKPKVQISPL